jgi:hypothetical protein
MIVTSLSVSLHAANLNWGGNFALSFQRALKAVRRLFEWRQLRTYLNNLSF